MLLNYIVKFPDFRILRLKNCERIGSFSNPSNTVHAIKNAENKKKDYLEVGDKYPK